MSLFTINIHNSEKTLTLDINVWDKNAPPGDPPQQYRLAPGGSAPCTVEVDPSKSPKGIITWLSRCDGHDNKTSKDVEVTPGKPVDVTAGPISP